MNWFSGDTLMVYTDLLVMAVLCSILYKVYLFAKKLKDHLKTMEGSTNRVRERIHLYSHIWIVASGFLSSGIAMVLEGLHIYYQDIMHNEAAVWHLEILTNISFVLVFLAYRQMVNHFISEETHGSDICYYGVREKNKDRRD